MNTLVSVSAASKSYAAKPLFTNLTFSITEGQKIGLVGPNGAGKSTLLKCLAETESLDDGQIIRKKGLQMGYSAQSREFCNTPLLDLFSLTTTFEKERLLSKAGFTNFSESAQNLSGGWKKRLDIVLAIEHAPDLLLLDEPTNHLDLEGIIWLEQFLKREVPSFFLVSHDRYFLENCCSTIIEINKAYEKGLFVVDGSYSLFLERKAAYLESQENYEKTLKSQARKELEWLKKTPKARTTKSTARVYQTKLLMHELSCVKNRNKKKTVTLSFTDSDRQTKKLLSAKNISKAYSENPLFQNVDLVLSPGTRLSIVGENGTGKTTLMKILRGILKPDTGTIKYADNLRLVYFDQHRQTLDENQTLMEALSPTGEFVEYHGSKIHVHGWAERFLFEKERMLLPVKYLSGGEKARILLAKLMLEPADILFLDEPTNDLDIETLEVIEESLEEFTGAVVLISHDRCLVDRISTQILGILKSGTTSFFSNYSQFEQTIKKESTKKETDVKESEQREKKRKNDKLSYHEKKELEKMEENIFAKENEVASLEDALTKEPDCQAHYQNLAKAQDTLETLYNRWQELINKDIQKNH